MRESMLDIVYSLLIVILNAEHYMYTVDSFMFVCINFHRLE